jgi:HAE1 family hydrophobic/amphiphilic exporter-1
MLIGTVFGMVLIPGLYVLFASFEKPKNLDASEKQAAPKQEPEPELVAH